MPRTRWVGFDLRNAFLGPVEISLDLFGGFHAVGEIGTRAFEASLSERLQLEELLLFGVEGAGSVFHSSIAEMNRLIGGDRWLPWYTHVCACLARLRSSGNGLTALPRRSFISSTRSTPDAAPFELSDSPAVLPA